MNEPVREQGSYALMDRDYGLNLNADGRMESPFKNSMFILSTVISTASASRGWVTLDAGTLLSVRACSV
jgi:D-serine deaminase-like pyridoxal phosphate-dependent protein